jgi:hypothetical protein
MPSLRSISCLMRLLHFLKNTFHILHIEL